MQIIPTAPTDNLYKFMAIFGMWLSIALIAVLAWFDFLSYHSTQELKASQSFYFSKDIDRKVEARLKAIQEGRLGEQKLDWTPEFKNASDEVKFLTMTHENHQKAMAKAELVMNRHSNTYFELLEAMGITWILPAYATFSILSMVVGFQRWHWKIQRPADKLVPVEFKLKETELKLKDAELKSKELEIKLKMAELQRVEREEQDRLQQTPCSQASSTNVTLVPLQSQIDQPGLASMPD